MQDLVIVIPDLCLPPADAEAPSGGAATLSPGFEQATRFGKKDRPPGGWRPWLARWLDREDLSAVPPAAVAAATLDLADGLSPTKPVPSVWFATPVYLIAGLNSIHADRRSLLRLPAQDLTRFAADFGRIFSEDEWVLKPLVSGEFILLGPQVPAAVTTEPARALVTDLNEALARGQGAAVLKRLGAELEMWLHSHPLNHSRQQHGELPVSTLWLWGGGPLGPLASVDGPKAAAFGIDPYLTGLWRLQGGAPQPLPDDLTEVIGSSTSRAVVVAEVTPALHANPSWTLVEALADLDRRFLTPALSALRQGLVEQVTLLINDRCFRLHRRDHWRLWHRRLSGLAALY